jgi:hypothetical protein
MTHVAEMLRTYPAASAFAATPDDASGVLRKACMTACRSCGDECERHARMHEHCRVCAQACRRCGQACQELISTLG